MKINKEQIDILVELQSIDTECARIKLVLVDLPRKIETLGADLEVYENELSDRENAFSEKKKEYREDESDVQMNMSKIKERDVKLLSVSDNKTYQILLREIDELKKKNSATEDKMLENLEYTEEEEVLLTQKKAEFEQAKTEIEKEKKDLTRP